MLSKINNYTDFFNKFQRNNVIFGVQVQIPIFASRTSSAVAFAQADLNAANLALEKKRSELSLDVRRKARLVREADLGGEVARLELQLAQENVRVLQAQFDQGRGSLKDLEAAHIEENDKWLAFLDANYARQQAQLDLLRTTGQLAQGAAVARFGSCEHLVAVCASDRKAACTRMSFLAGRAAFQVRYWLVLSVGCTSEYSSVVRHQGKKRMPEVMKTLFLNPPSYEGFDGGAGARYQARREIKSFWYPTWLAQPAAMVPGSRLIDAPPGWADGGSGRSAGEGLRIGRAAHQHAFVCATTRSLPRTSRK